MAGVPLHGQIRTEHEQILDGTATECGYTDIDHPGLRCIRATHPHSYDELVPHVSLNPGYNPDDPVTVSPFIQYVASHTQTPPEPSPAPAAKSGHARMMEEWQELATEVSLRQFGIKS
jgi:hypothetical protein